MRLASLVVLLSFVASGLWAQPATLVRDLETGFHGGSSDPRQMTALGDRVVFTAEEPSSGREVWASDGTAEGTVMLADACPGECSGEPEILGSAGDVVFWVVSQVRGSGTDQIWRSDGTRAGTWPLALQVSRPIDEDSQDLDLLPFPHAFFRGSVYFDACEPGVDCGLWRSDGTEAGTAEVANLPAFSWAPAVTIRDAILFIRFQTLWKTDGTPAGTVPVADFQAAPRALTAAGRRAFFVAARGGGDELWTTDGTRQGTRAVTRFGPASPFEPYPGIKAAEQWIYFVANDGVHGQELWRSNGTAAGTRRITDLENRRPFTANAPEYLLADTGTRIVFQALDAAGRARVWGTDGNPGSTTLLDPCRKDCIFSPLAAYRGRVLFVGNDGAHGHEVWSTDGTPAGTRMLRDFCPGRCGNVHFEPHPISGGVAFGALEGPLGPSQLWSSDGTEAGTRRLTDFTAPSSGAAFSELELVEAGGKLFFNGGKGYGLEPWVLEDGETRQVANIFPETASSFPHELAAVGDRLFFGAARTEPLRFGLWQTAGTAETTVEAVADVRIPFDSLGDDCSPYCPRRILGGAGGAFFLRPDDGRDHFQLWWTAGSPGEAIQLTSFDTTRYITQGLTGHQGAIFFFVYRGSYRELWTSDGTPNGTEKLADLGPSDRDTGLLSTPEGLFFGINSNEGEIWTSDGTPGGTRRIAKLPAVWRLTTEPLAAAGGTLYFGALRSDSAGALWKTDGTQEGTGLVFSPSGTFYPFQLQALGDTLIFLSVLPPIGSGSSRMGLWRSDGTPEGTFPIRELTDVRNVDDFLWDRKAIPWGLTPFAGRIFFAAQSGPEGVELWSTDGTAEGTRLVRDIAPQGHSFPTGFTVGGGKLYFAAHDGIHGFELWESDGTADGTRLVQDIAPGLPSSFPTELTAVGDRLDFTADDGLRGREVWTLATNGPRGCQPSATALCLQDSRFRVEAIWRDHQGSAGTGTAVPLTGDTGYFWFFDPANAEVVAKVLDGRELNDHHWVFYGALSDVEYSLIVTDTQTGLTRQYFNPAGQLASTGDTHGFGPLGASSPQPVVAPSSPPALVSGRTEPAKATGTCTPGPRRLCLNDGRFAVEASWKDFQGHTGNGTAVPLTGDTGWFWFFDPSNVEVMLKVLDGTPLNGKFWVFYGALSNVEYTLTVTDTQTGAVKEYRNPSGRFASVADTGAF